MACYMKSRLQLIIPIIILSLIIIPGTACSEYYGIPQQTFSLKTNELIADFGVANHDQAVTVNTSPEIFLSHALVIVGSRTDNLEETGFSQFIINHTVYPAYILNDSQRTIAGCDIEEFDLIVIGGPEHNNYTKELLNRGIIRYNQTSTEMPGLVIETAITPSKHVIVIIGSVDGYSHPEKDLPLNGIIPEDYAPVAAVAAGAGLGFLGIFLSPLLSKSFEFLYGYIITLAGEIASEKESELRHLKARITRKSLIFGYSMHEILIAISCVIIFGLAFVIADRLAILPENIVVYMFVGGFVVIAHDLGHRLIACMLKFESEFRFWGLGTFTMLLTSWLFGMVFAQPSRVLIEKDQHTASEKAAVMLAGPAISLLLSLVFLLVAIFGGKAVSIGWLGFSMNMVTVVYSLMPFNPMDGKCIYDWNKFYWALLFFPVAFLYIVASISSILVTG